VLPQRRRSDSAPAPAPAAPATATPVREAAKTGKKRAKPRRPKRARKITPLLVWARKTENWTPRRLRKLRLAAKITRFRLKLRSAQRAAAEDAPVEAEEAAD
jgi:hypothetical protein